jgi:hypothetical protein
MFMNIRAIADAAATNAAVHLTVETAKAASSRQLVGIGSVEASGTTSGKYQLQNRASTTARIALPTKTKVNRRFMELLLSMGECYQT